MRAASRPIEARGKKLGAARLAMVERAKSDATIGWDASPITTARMCAEVYAQIKDEDWSLVGNAIRNTWPHRLWNFDKAYRWNGGSGGAGVGYNAPASLGAALANKRHGRLTVTFQGDGDLMFVPSTLWTAAHHRIPILYVVHNNRAYHQEYMYLQAMAARHGRGIENAHIGTTITDPECRLCDGGARLRRPWRGPDHRSEGSRTGVEARNRGGQERPARAGRRRHRSALRSSPMTRFNRLIVAAAVLLGAGSLAAPTRAQDAPAGDAAKGKRIYLADGCFTCHGRSGQGGAYNGPAPFLAKTQMPFDGFKGQLRAPSNDMPAYSDAVMSDQDIADIYAFVQSLPGRGNAKDIAILNN